MNENSVNAAAMEAQHLLQVYAQLNLTPTRAQGVYIFCGERLLVDWYGGHAVAALGYAHPEMLAALDAQSKSLFFQSNAVPLEVRARAADALCDFAPDGLTRAFFVNSGAEANENALRIACRTTGRRKVLAIEHGFHGRTAAAGAVTWNSAGRWYGFPDTPFDVDFIPRDDVEAARNMIDDSVAAVIFEPVQGVAGAYDLSGEFVKALRDETARAGAILIADEVQSGMGRTGHFFAVQHSNVEPDILTAAKALGGGIPCGALLTTAALSAELQVGDLGTTFGGGPLASAAIVAVIDAIHAENLLDNVREREAEIHAQCIAGPVTGIQGKGFLTGLICDRPAKDVRNALLDRDILTGTSADPAVLRLLPPLVLEATHVKRLAAALNDIA